MDDRIIKLREETGAGVMECKRALDKAQGDMKKALDFIREAGIEKAESKKERKTGAGFLGAYVHNNRVGVLMEMRAETDFVVRSEPFQAMAHELLLHIAAMAPESVEALLEQPFVKDEKTTVGDLVKSVTGKVGENIKVERFTRYEI
ncbi:translation elongation factor Ts [Patescibacteria group bacterium]|nr:translation elongation factor Ts [Patescibacteria group bacterium]